VFEGKLTCLKNKVLLSREVLFSFAYLNWLQGKEDESAESTIKPD
jgi:hypothetical protein